MDLAIGMLMERHHLTEKAARRVLEGTASTDQHSLVEAARELLVQAEDHPR